MGTAIKHPVPDRVSNCWHLGTLTLRTELQSAQVSKITNDIRPKLVWHRMLYSCTHMATVDVKGLHAPW